MAAYGSYVLPTLDAMLPPITPSPELVSFLESQSEPHILCDRHYRILAANKAYRERWQSRTEIIGKRCHEISHHYPLPCDQMGESCPLQHSLLSGERERIVHLHHTPQGERYENIELSPVRDNSGEIAFFIEKIDPLPVQPASENRQTLMGRSPSFMEMMTLVARVAPSDAAVLLQGESGTGKELVANAVHQLSRRANKPFVAVDCSGLAETLFESELFGHERGAFTGAIHRKIGLVEAASGGTLFLDEVGDIPLGIQVKLLRLLETGTFRRVGSTEVRQADIRLISATHRPLADMVEAETFRQDLYYRLNVFPIFLPALRERNEDIELLANALLPRVSQGRTLRLNPAALLWLQTYPFPGNVRELRNLLERAALLCDGEEIDARHFPMPVTPIAPGKPRPTPLARLTPLTSGNKLSDADLRQISQAFQGNRKALANYLGLSERTLYRRLQALEAGEVNC